MQVGSAQGLDVALPHLTNILQTSAAPSKAFATGTHDQKVRHESRVTAVAVWKSLDCL